jgi:hypothetical protein
MYSKSATLRCAALPLIETFYFLFKVDSSNIDRIRNERKKMDLCNMFGRFH